MSEAEVRDGQDDKERQVRMKWNHQYIFNSTLKGEHLFLENGKLKLDWSAVWSKAFSETPDNAEIYLQGTHVQTSGAAVRRWEHNSDQDKAAYVNLSYKLQNAANGTFDFSVGGMYRDKKIRNVTVSSMNILLIRLPEVRILSTWVKTGIISMKYFLHRVRMET